MHGVSPGKRPFVQPCWMNRSFPHAVPEHPRSPILPVFSVAALLTEVCWRAFSSMFSRPFPGGDKTGVSLLKLVLLRPEREVCPPCLLNEVAQNHLPTSFCFAPKGAHKYFRVPNLSFEPETIPHFRERTRSVPENRSLCLYFCSFLRFRENHELENSSFS